jgi:hypothetical protein
MYWIPVNYVYLGLFAQKRQIRSLTKCQIISNAAQTGNSENKHLQLIFRKIAAF